MLQVQVVLDYGVYDAERPLDGYVLPLSIPEGDDCFDDKADIVEQAGFQPTTSFTLWADRAPSEDFLAFLRLVQLSGAPLSLPPYAPDQLCLQHRSNNASL